MSRALDFLLPQCFYKTIIQLLIFLSCFFFLSRLGLFVGSRPFTIIAVSSTIFALSLIGLLRFQREARIEKLWAEPGTHLFDNKEFVEEHFPDEYQIALQLGVREPRKLASGDLNAGIFEAAAIHQVPAEIARYIF